MNAVKVKIKDFAFSTDINAACTGKSQLQTAPTGECRSDLQVTNGEVAATSSSYGNRGLETTPTGKSGKSQLQAAPTGIVVWRLLLRGNRGSRSYKQLLRESWSETTPTGKSGKSQLQTAPTGIVVGNHSYIFHLCVLCGEFSYSPALTFHPPLPSAVSVLSLFR